MGKDDQQNSRLLWGALAASLAAHGALYFWLRGGYPSSTLGGLKHGVVSVDFVEPYSHMDKADESVGGRSAPKKSRHSGSAQNAKAQGPEGDPAAVATESNLFISTLTSLIDRHKIYPREAVEREEEGKVVLGLTVERDGRISKVEIERPCPFDLLNQAAISTVRGIGQFPPVPDVVPAPMHLHVPLVFRIERP